MNNIDKNILKKNINNNANRQSYINSKNNNNNKNYLDKMNYNNFNAINNNNQNNYNNPIKFYFFIFNPISEDY